MQNKKLKKPTMWDEDEIAKLKELYPVTLNSDLAKILGKSLSSIEKKGHQLGLSKSKEFRSQINKKNADSSPRCKSWTNEEEEFLVENYKKKSGKDIAKKLGRSYASIIYKAQKLGLKKNKKRTKAVS